jgi:hypothetical protein
MQEPEFCVSATRRKRRNSGQLPAGEESPESDLAEPEVVQRSLSYLSSKCVVTKQTAKGGYAVRAREAIAPMELIAVWSGRIVHWRELLFLSPKMKSYTVQVEEDLYLTSLDSGEPSDLINHSCNPNVGLSGQISLVAMRAIAAGEEITIDYAMADGSCYDEFFCSCGSAKCRGRVTGNDWRDPDLWERYRGFFSPYLQRRIDHLCVAVGEQRQETARRPKKSQASRSRSTRAA